MKKRGIQPDISLMSKIPYLNKEDRSKVKYLSRLKTVLLYPVMGVDLRYISDAIDCPLVDNDLQQVNVMEAVYFIQVLQALEKAKRAEDTLMGHFSFWDKVDESFMTEVYSDLRSKAHPLGYHL